MKVAIGSQFHIELEKPEGICTRSKHSARVGKSQQTLTHLLRGRKHRSEHPARISSFNLCAHPIGRYYYPHFTDEETGAGRRNNLPTELAGWRSQDSNSSRVHETTLSAAVVSTPSPRRRHPPRPCGSPHPALPQGKQYYFYGRLMETVISPRSRIKWCGLCSRRLNVDWHMFPGQIP